MMFRVHGLYGHIQRNNFKAVALFGAFLCLFVALNGCRYLVPYLLVHASGHTAEERGNLDDALDEVLDPNQDIFKARVKLLGGEIDHDGYAAIQGQARQRRLGVAGRGIVGSDGSYDMGQIMLVQFYHSLPLALALGALYLVVATWWNGLFIRFAMRARPLARKEQPDLYNLVENLAIRLGLPCPAIELIDSPQLNAYASGLTPAAARIGVTTGLVATLNRDELEAVIAHELTHIASGDSRLMALTKACVDLITYYPRQQFERARKIPWPAWIFIVMLLVIVGSRAAANAFLPIMVGFAVSALAVLLAYLVKAMILHSREFVADAGAIELTKNPAALIAALRKIAGADDLAVKSFGAQAMLFSNGADGLFSTHPSIESRMAAIREHGGATAADEIENRTRVSRIVTSPMPNRPMSATPSQAAFGRRGQGLARADGSIPRAARRFETQATAQTIWRDPETFSAQHPSEQAGLGDSLFERWVLSGRVDRMAAGVGALKVGLRRGIVYVWLGLFVLGFVLPALFRAGF